MKLLSIFNINKNSSKSRFKKLTRLAFLTNHTNLKIGSIPIVNQNKNHSSGIVLIEIISVISIMSVIAGFSLLVNFKATHTDSFRANRDLLVAVLQRARSQAMNNICLGDDCVDGKSHGIHINTNGGFVTNYEIFQGEPYNSSDPTNMIIDAGEKTSQNISLLSGSPTDIYFEQLSGNSNPGIITLSNGTETSAIIINSEGQITWTN